MQVTLEVSIQFANLAGVHHFSLSTASSSPSNYFGISNEAFTLQQDQLPSYKALQATFNVVTTKTNSGSSTGSSQASPGMIAGTAIGAVFIVGLIVGFIAQKKYTAYKQQQSELELTSTPTAIVALD